MASVPELPDVEHFRRTLAEFGPGREIRRIIVTDPGILRNADPVDVDRAMRGRRLREPERRGKWLIAPTDAPALLIHFGMTGDLLWSLDDSDRHRHDRVILVLDTGEIRYRNMRKLGGPGWPRLPKRSRRSSATSVRTRSAWTGRSSSCASIDAADGSRPR
jgi:formamidopyrimidine-DNA glycosylase